MDIKSKLSFLIKDYGLKYKYQEFHNCYGLNMTVYTHSFYNSNGCFTIHDMPCKGELDFYYSQSFSTMHADLCKNAINISSIEPEIWKKHTKILIFNRPFFWWSKKRIIDALAEVLYVHINKEKEFFGIKIDWSAVKCGTYD